VKSLSLNVTLSLS